MNLDDDLPSPPRPGVEAHNNEDGTVTVNLTARLGDLATVLQPQFHAELVAKLRPAEDQEQ